MHRSQNLKTTLKRRNRAEHPMMAYDRLPPELRNWLAQAALPWSAQSALRLWHKSLRLCNGSIPEARSELTRIERQRISRDARHVWGRDYPTASDSEACQS